MAKGAAKRKLSKVALPLGVGLGVTLMVLVMQLMGWLDRLQGYFYDVRATYFQYFASRPTDTLMHLHIDDKALDVIGGWPWPRSNLGRIIDELSLAEPKVVAFDFIFIEAQSHKAIGDQGKVLTLTGKDEDKAFADAIKRAGNVVLPIRFGVHTAEAAREKAVLVLVADLEQDKEAVVERLNRAKDAEAAKWVQQGDSNYWGAFDEAAMRRIDGELAFGHEPQTLAKWRERLLPKENKMFVTDERLRRIQKLILKVKAIRMTYRFTRPAQEARDPVMVADDVNPPVLALAGDISGTGFVNSFLDDRGVLRTQPLVVNYEGHLYPQLGLTLALKMLGVPWERVRVEPGQMVIPAPGGDIVVPTHKQWSTTSQQEVGTIMNIPWFGDPATWKTIYQDKTAAGQAKEAAATNPATNAKTANRKAGADEADTQESQRSITKIWDIITLEETLKFNLKELDAVLPGLLVMVDQDALAAYTTREFTPSDVAGRVAFIEPALAKAKDKNGSYYQYLTKTDEEIEKEPDAQDRHMLKAFRTAVKGLPLLKEELLESQKKIIDARAQVRQMIKGKAVLIGWVATGALADIAKTSLHSVMPGVIAHGVIYNGIMRDEMWSPAPEWADIAVTLSLGVLMTVLVVYLQPVQGTLCALLLGGGYFFINGLVVFDYGNVLLELAGPLTAITFVWMLTTLMKVLEERAERARITARFRSYVDPALVQYVIDHPEEEVLTGQKREMTVVFTDLAGFTTISEILQEKTVEILNEYIDLVVPIIKEQNGLVNKFLGDGVMFFYGAPELNQEHALCAVKTVLKLQEALVVFNEGLKKRGLPTVKMRAGVASGPMIVGDAGGRGRSDYTVLGDTVNTSARLESANKATGSLMMVNQRVVELVPPGMFLFRPMARLTVVGKSKPVMVYEPMAYMDRANMAQLKYVEATTLMVEAFIKGEFAQCIKQVEALERLAGGDKLTNTYRTLSEKYLNEGLPLGFDGQIVLSEK